MTKLMRCNACGEGFNLGSTDEFNHLPPTFCPICGTPTLARTASVMGTDARCFAAYGETLTRLLYQVWRMPDRHLDETGGAVMPARFIDYIREATS